MKILVTGASGFIADYVIKELLALGHSIVATSRSKMNVAHREWFQQVNFIEYDLKESAKEPDLFMFFGSPDLMIHLAWGNLPDFKTELHITEDLEIHYRFIESMIRSGLKDVTVTGTCLEYGLIEGELEESQLLNPITNYGKAKNTLRIRLEELQKSRNFSLKWLRLFYVYGEGQSTSSIYSQMNKAILDEAKEFNMSPGEQERDYLPVAQMANYIALAALQKNVDGLINCCSGKPIPIKKFVQDFFDLHNYSIKLNLGFYQYTDYEPLKFWGNTDKLNKIINSQCRQQS